MSSEIRKSHREMRFQKVSKAETVCFCCRNRLFPVRKQSVPTLGIFTRRLPANVKRLPANVKRLPANVKRLFTIVIDIHIFIRRLPMLVKIFPNFGQK